MSLDERPRGSTRPTPKVHYNSLPRTSIEGALDIICRLPLERLCLQTTERLPTGSGLLLSSAKTQMCSESPPPQHAVALSELLATEKVLSRLPRSSVLAAN